MRRSVRRVLIILAFVALGAGSGSGWYFSWRLDKDLDSTRASLETQMDAVKSAEAKAERLEASLSDTETELDRIETERDDLAVQVENLLAAIGSTTAAPAEPALIPLAKYQGTIQGAIRDEYQYLFCGDASAREMSYWTDWIIEQGMTLQRQGLTAEEAMWEAITRFVLELEAGDEARWQEENFGYELCAPRPV